MARRHRPHARRVRYPGISYEYRDHVTSAEPRGRPAEGDRRGEVRGRLHVAEVRLRLDGREQHREGKNHSDRYEGGAGRDGSAGRVDPSQHAEEPEPAEE